MYPLLLILAALLSGCAANPTPGAAASAPAVGRDSAYAEREVTVVPRMLNRAAFNQEFSARLQRLPRESRGGGTIRHRVLVDETGEVREIRLVRSSGKPDLDRAVADALRVARFSPGTLHGVPVKVWTEHAMRIEIRIIRM